MAILNLALRKVFAWLAVTPTYHEVVAVVPCRIIPDIGFDHIRRPFQLLRFVEQIESFDQPLPVAPDMVILRVLLQHRVYELRFSLGRSKRVDDGVSVVPDLVILQVLEGSRVQPCNFIFERDAEF